MTYLCKDKNGNSHIVNENGCLLASGKNALVCYDKYCKKYGKSTREKLTVANGKLYYDSKHDKYIPQIKFESEFETFDDDLQESYNFSFKAYIKERMRKNGLLKEV